MSSETKKSIKKTTADQFQKLTGLMEEFPHLATGSPTFGSSRAAMEQTWDTVAQRLNAYGPPERNGGEWKKVWQDQKCRLKKKIGENNKSIHGTGGGPCYVNNLTALELDIDRICHLSSAAAPSGKVFGVSTATKKLQFTSCSQKIVLDVTPPRTHNKVAVVTPTTTTPAKQRQIHVTSIPINSRQPPIFTSNIKIREAPLPTIPSQGSQSPIITAIDTPPKQSQPKIISLEPTRPFSHYRKRKFNENHTEKHEQLKLLRKQLEVQENSLDAMRAQAEAAKCSAEAAKAQAEAAKAQAEAAKAQAEAAKAEAEAAKAQAEALKEIATSSKIIAEAMVGFLKHVRDDDY